MSASDAERSQTAAAASADAASAYAATADADAIGSHESAIAADQSAVASATSATAAHTSETNAASSASAALASQITANAAATTATNSRDAAATSEKLATQYANAPVNTEVEPGKYSAYHWSEQARLNLLGSLIYKGGWDASKGAYPTSPKLGDFYLITVAGTMGGNKHSVGDMMLYDGSTWDRVDNQQSVTSVAGRTGAVVLTMDDVGGLPVALNGKQNSLGFTPVQQGGGVGQGTNTVKIGWANDGSSKVKVTIDVTDQGNIAMEAWANNRFIVRGAQNGSANTAFTSSSPPGIKDISASGNDGNTALRISNNGNNAASSVISFLRDGQFGCHFGLDQDNVLRYGGWSFGAVAYRVLHEGISNPTFASQLNVNNADIRCTNWVYASNFQIQSDKRLKSYAVRLDGRKELENLKRLIARSYVKAEKLEYGLFAQELRDVYPSMVDSGDGPAGPDTLSVFAMELLAPIVAAIQHLDRRMTDAGL
jgi:hypothetical protein